MNRLVLPGILAVALLAPVAFAQQGQLDASPTLFTVMSALNMAGYDADLDSPLNNPLRAAVRAELAKRNIPSLAAIKTFVQQHHAPTDSGELSQYISFALTAGPPPDFAITMRDVDLPPDVPPLMGFSKLLAVFYKEAGIEDLWKAAQPAIDRMIIPYHGPVSDAVLKANAYLRQDASGFKGFHFQIFLEPLAAPNQIHSRSYGNNYTIVVTPSAQPRIAEIRQAYLYYVLDPLATRNREILERKKVLMDHAARARLLSDDFKQDMLLLTTGSLVRAVIARMDRNPDLVQQALKQGFILTPYFSEALVKFEKQEQSMALYYTSMVQSIDLAKEDARLSNVQFARPEVAPAPAAPPPPPAVPAAVEMLQKAEDLLKAQNLTDAEKLFREALHNTDNNALQAAANYGLARVALTASDPEAAESLLETSLNLHPDPPVKAWVLVYLGRLRLEVNDKSKAALYFQDALNTEGTTDQARRVTDLAHEEARKGLQQIK